jgi:HK97 family phage portal protein
VGIPLHQFNDLNSYLQTGCKKVWATFRACHIVASVVTSTTFRLLRQSSRDEVQAGPLYDLWTNPNDWDSLREMLYQWVFHMKLTGQAYWVKDEVNTAGQPMNLYPLLPQHVILVPDAKYGVSQYIYRVNGRDLRFSHEEVIHFRRPHPCDPIRGLGDIEPSQDLYNDFINRNVYEERFLENGAQPSGILTYRGTDEMPADMSDMSDEEWGKLKRWWQAEYGGKRNAGKTAFLSGAWEYTRLGLTQQEMSTIERDRASVEQIFMNHGVPLSLAGWTNAANYATARLDELNFRKYEVVPLLEILVGKLNQQGVLVKNFDAQASLEYDLDGLIDVEQVHKDYRPLVDIGGMTLNELRSRMGLPEGEDPFLNQFYGNRGQVPLEMIGAAMPTEEAIQGVLAGNGETPAPEAVAVEVEGSGGVDPIAEEQSAAPTEALNGAQIQSLVAIAVAVAEGQLPKDTGIQIIAASFPFTEERAARILEQVMEDSIKPAPPAAPFGAPVAPEEGAEAPTAVDAEGDNNAPVDDEEDEDEDEDEDNA